MNEKLFNYINDNKLLNAYKSVHYYQTSDFPRRKISDDYIILYILLGFFLFSSFVIFHFIFASLLVLLTGISFLIYRYSASIFSYFHQIFDASIVESFERDFLHNKNNLQQLMQTINFQRFELFDRNRILNEITENRFSIKTIELITYHALALQHEKLSAMFEQNNSKVEPPNFFPKQ
jgi:hypothetical protein